MLYPYIIVDHSNDSNIHETLHKLERFSNFYSVGTANNNEEALDLIVEMQPMVVFLTIDATGLKNGISLSLISQLHQYLSQLPYFVIISDTQKHCYDSIKAGAFDYLLKPLQSTDVTKCLLRVQKHALPTRSVQVAEAQQPLMPALHKDETGGEVPLQRDNMQICIKSYGDYQFISLNDVVYLKADNNTTDFYLQSGRKLTAYKTLKHYENNLPVNFYRIHNSYIVNSDYITRISTGKSLCYLNGNEIAVSFSKTYKENLDILIRNISTDYL